MRGLTVRNPWAWAIVAGGKDVENRTAEWTYRGELAIHAGKQWSDRGAASPLVLDAWAAFRGGHTDLGPGSLTMSAVIGVVDLVDVHLQHNGCCDSRWAEKTYRAADGRERLQLTHLVLEHPIAFRHPVPAAGALGLWKPNHYLRAAIDDERRAS